MLRRQVLADVVTVPTSDKPEMKEWTGHYWYVLRCGALQASSSLTDAEALNLIEWFKGFAVTTPCPDCRAHYSADLILYPFEMQHARNPMLAMFWVEELRLRIEQRKAAKKVVPTSASVSASASALAPVPTTPEKSSLSLSTPLSTPSPEIVVGPVSGPSGPVSGPSEPVSDPVEPRSTGTSAPGLGSRMLIMGGRRQAVIPMLPRTAGVGNSSMRKLAIQSAMQQTIANRVAEKAGVPRGCGCGKKKPSLNVV